MLNIWGKFLILYWCYDSYMRFKLRFYVAWSLTPIYICSFDEEILHIFGSLSPDHTGSIRWLDKKSEDVSVDRFKLILDSLEHWSFKTCKPSILVHQLMTIFAIWLCRSNRKRREGLGKTDLLDNGTIGEGASSLSNDRRMKKSKKHRSDEDH